MSKSIKFKNNTYLDSKGITHNKKLLSDILNKYVVNSNNYVVTPNVDIPLEYTGTGTYVQRMISIVSPWYQRYLPNKWHYMRLRIFYIQNSKYNKPWNCIVVGRNINGDNWSKRDFFNSNAVTQGDGYSIYEKVLSYHGQETMNDFINFILEGQGCGCTIKWVEFCEVIPMNE